MFSFWDKDHFYWGKDGFALSLLRKMEKTTNHYFRQRVSPVENLTFIAMMAGFDAIVSLVAGLLPLSAIFVMLLVPFTSACVAIYCRGRFIPVYLFAAMGICLALSAWNITNTIFYVFPALLTGSFYGFLRKLTAPHSVNIFASTLLSLGLFYLSILFLKATTGVDMIVFLLNAIQKAEDPLAPNIFPTFAFAYSLAQIALTHLFMESQFAHLGKDEFHEEKVIPFACLGTLVFGGISAVLAFFHAKSAYLFLGFTIYWSLFALYWVFTHGRVTIYIILGLTFFAGWLGFAATYALAPVGSGLALLSIPLASLGLICFLNYVLLRNSKKKPRIEI